MAAAVRLGALPLKLLSSVVVAACSSSGSGGTEAKPSSSEAGGTCTDAQNGRCVDGAAGRGGGGTSSDAMAGSSGTDEDLFTVTASLSPTIESVGIVDWSVSATVDTAHIDFGRDPGAFEFTAPVDNPSSTGNQTLLLGMKPSTTYSFRIMASEGGSAYTSAVYEITTGPVPNGLPTVTMSPKTADGVYEGFTLGCFFSTSGGLGDVRNTSGGWTFVLDKDGTYVWWYRSDAVGQDCVRTRMSYDGRYMWMANGNVPGPSNGTLARVGMDGADERIYSVPLRHHDICILPDETVAYFEYSGGSSGCDVVKELNPETEATTTVFEVQQANPEQADECHSNAIDWWPDQELYTLSVMYWDGIIAFTRAGSLSWIFGGSASTYSGASWSRQHEHHLLSDSIVLFNNNGSNGSSVLEYQMDGGSAQLVYDHANGHTTQSMGGVRRLPNGNTLVTYSNQGVIHEVDPSWQLLQETTTSGVGYIVRRATLYGPPPSAD